MSKTSKSRKKKIKKIKSNSLYVIFGVIVATLAFLSGYILKVVAFSSNDTSNENAVVSVARKD